MKMGINWDVLGAMTSLACAIHCAILPLVLTSLPLFGVNIIDNIGFEYLMILIAFLIGSLALWHGFRHHHRRFLPLTMFTCGMLFLVAKQLWHQYQYWLLPIAVVLIVAAHAVNYRYSTRARVRQKAYFCT